MDGIALRIYVQEFTKHKKVLLYEWLLKKAKKMGIKGASVFCGIAGVGRHGVTHEEHFFELASNVPMEILFIGKVDEIDRFLLFIKDEGLSLFYTKTSIEFGYTNVQ